MTMTLPPVYSRVPVIVGYARTPLGSFLGSLCPLSGPQLAGFAISGVMQKIGLDPSKVEECIMGNVVQSGMGQAPARQAALHGGLPPSTVCTTVNKICASGMKSVMMAAQTIRLGEAQCVVAGGMESMSNIPYYLPRTVRQGLRMGNHQLVDGMIHDGLWCAAGGEHMGAVAEKCARDLGISREEQDDHAVESFRRAQRARASGALAEEIVPVAVPTGGGGGGRKGGGGGASGSVDCDVVDADESLKQLDEGSLRALRPAFDPQGTVTAGNASILADGAAALVVMSEELAGALGLPVLARILSSADAEQSPENYPTTPALAARTALERAGLTPADVDLWELNEAFSVVDIANRRLLGIENGAGVNLLGGAVALGHPIGMSGTRILGTLAMGLQRRGRGLGLATICNGGGGASAVLLERR